MQSEVIDSLIRSLQSLPGIGVRSAQRIAMHLLEHNREGGKILANNLLQAMDKINNCRLCRNLTELETCKICSSEKRDHSTICVVETPMDLFAIEQAGVYSGLYFVLMGKLSPIDRTGPKEIGLDILETRIADGEIRELIIATSATVEGEATSHYIASMAEDIGVKATRLAHGIPLGGELEYIDGATLSHAFSGRR
ncbi:MAG: recombination protein RecR [Gammaproteobacteria bacterium]|nr:MAG: recombination protein RecR [Gammaproteobacteria bacterium]